MQVSEVMVEAQASTLTMKMNLSTPTARMSQTQLHTASGRQKHNWRMAGTPEECLTDSYMLGLLALIS